MVEASNLIIISLLLSLSCSISCVVCATLTVAPVSVTTGPFTSVDFTCEGTGDQLTWIAGGAPPTDAFKQQRDISVTNSHSGSNLSSVLTITALPVNDNIGIGCRINSFNPFSEIFADPGTLTIRGVSSVEDLELSFTSNNSLHITWSPPVFYSNDVPFGATFSYHVTVTDDFETGDPIIDSTISDTTIILDNITRCDTFNVNVTASIAQYTSVNNSIGNSGSYSIEIKKHDVALDEVPINFEVTCAPTLCDSIVSIAPLYDGSSVPGHRYLVVNGSNKYNSQSINYTLTDLEPFRNYNITVKVMNIQHQPKGNDHLMISTYYVQGLIINTRPSNDQKQYNNGSVRVKCLFIEGSTADGCHVIFSGTTDQAIEQQAFNITGSNGRIVTLSVSSNYTVTAYDLVNGTIIGPAVEYPTPIEVIVLHPALTNSIFISSSMSAISYKATSSTISVTSVSLSPTASNILQTTDDTVGILTVAITVTVSIIVLLVLLVVILMVYLIIKKRKKKTAAVTTNGELALCYQPHADTNDYMERPQLTNVLFNNEETVPDSPAIDQSTPTVPYFIPRSEFITGPSLPSDANATTTDMTQEQLPTSTINQANNFIPHDDGAASDSKHLYAELTPASKEKVPPTSTGDTSVQYSTVAEHTNEGDMTTYPINERPPPEYNINSSDLQLMKTLVNIKKQFLIADTYSTGPLCKDKS